MGYQVGENDNNLIKLSMITYHMITITLGSHAYTSEHVQLSEHVGRELHSHPKKFSIKAKLSITQNMSSYNTPSSERFAILSDSCAVLGYVADVGGSQLQWWLQAQ